jgi:DNA-binding MarR family transcriptional regulator
MEKELQILTEISENERVSQRQLAKITGLSLGTVNAIIQKMVKNGLIKIAQLNSKTVRYILTPQGMKEKAKKTYDYVVASYNMISKIKMNTRKIINEYVKQGIDMFYIYGEDDEVYRIVKMSLIEAKREHNINYEKIEDIEGVSKNKKFVILAWNLDRNENMDCIENILC